MDSFDLKKFILPPELARERDKRTFARWMEEELKREPKFREESRYKERNGRLQRVTKSIRCYDPIPIRKDQPLAHDPLHITFDSVHHLMEYVGQSKGAYTGISPADYPNQTWNWNYCIENVLDLYKKGWVEGLDAVKGDLAKAIEAAISKTTEVTDLERNYTGSFIDVGAVVNGDPMNMWDFVDTERAIMRLKLEIDAFVYWEIPAEEIMMRGIAIMAAILALKRTNCLVEAQYNLTMNSYSVASNFRAERHILEFPILRANDTENLTETMLVLAHPGFLRSVIKQAWGMAFGTAYKNWGTLCRTDEEMTPKSGSGHVVVPGIFPAAEYLGHFFGMRWTSITASMQLLETIMSCAAPAIR